MDNMGWIVTIGVVVAGFLVRWGDSRAQLREAREWRIETKHILENIHREARTTNGRVSELEIRVAVLESER